MKVLIVEDDADMVAIVREIVEMEGHEIVGPASSVESALSAAELDCPDVAFIDMGLTGEMLGLEGAQFLRRQCPSVQIVFITGCSDQVVIEACAVVQPLDYLIKPISKAQILVVLLRAAIGFKRTSP